MSTGFIEPIGAEVFAANEVFVEQDAQPAQLAPVAHPAAATPVKATADTGPITSITQLPSIWTMEVTIEWLVEDMIPLGGITLISADSGAGKTWVAYAIGGAVARGVPFAGHAVRQRPVVYLDGENPAAVVKQRLADLGIPPTPDFHIWGGWVSESPHGPCSEILLDYVRRVKPLLIWDSLIEFHSGDEQSAKETRDFMKKVRVLTNAGATVIILHHTGKTVTSQEYRGSSDIKGAVDAAYLLKSAGDGGTLSWVSLENFKSRFAPAKDFGLVFRSRHGFDPWELPKKTAKLTPDAAVQAILQDHPNINGNRIKELAKQEFDVGKNRIDSVLQNADWLRRQPGTGNETLYSLAEDRNPEIPTPKREGNREIKPLPAEEVA